MWAISGLKALVSSHQRLNIILIDVVVVIVVGVMNDYAPPCTTGHPFVCPSVPFARWLPLIDFVHVTSNVFIVG